MGTVLFTMFIHYCTTTCDTQPLYESWQSLEQCQKAIPKYYKVAPGEYFLECRPNA